MPKTPVHVGIIVPSFQSGYVENWLLKLAQYADRSRVKWTGMCLMEWSREDPNLTGPMSRVMPVYGTPNPPEPDAPHDFDNVQRNGESASYGILQTAAASDVLLCWGVSSSTLELVSAYLKPKGLKSIALSQSKDAPDGDKRYGLNADLCVAGFPEAVGAFNRRARKKAEVIHNGVDVNSVCPSMPRHEIKERLSVRSCTNLIGFCQGDYAPYVSKLLTAAGTLTRSYKLVPLTPGFDVSRHKEKDKFLVVDNAEGVGTGDLFHALDAVVHFDGDLDLGRVAPQAWLSRVPLIASREAVESGFGDLIDRHCYMPLPAPGSKGFLNKLSSQLADCLSGGGLRSGVVDGAFNAAWRSLSIVHSAERWASTFERLTGATNES